MITPLTTDRYNSGSAAWSADGKWIYFRLRPRAEIDGPQPVGLAPARSLFRPLRQDLRIALKKGTRFAISAAGRVASSQTRNSQTCGQSCRQARRQTAAKPAEKPKVEKIDIDLDGIAARLQEVPVPPGNYRDLQVAGERLCWIDDDPADFQKSSLECVPIANKGEKPETCLEGVRGFEVSADGKKMLVHKQNDLYVLDSSIIGRCPEKPEDPQPTPRWISRAGVSP